MTLLQVVVPKVPPTPMHVDQQVAVMSLNYLNFLVDLPNPHVFLYLAESEAAMGSLPATVHVEMR